MSMDDLDDYWFWQRYDALYYTNHGHHEWEECHCEEKEDDGNQSKAGE